MIIGNLGGDPEMKYLPSGSAVTTFRVAASRKFTPPGGGEPKEETEWFSVTAFDKLAETCNQYLQKGKQVYVEGRLRTRSWDGQDGQKHYRTEVIANTMVMLGSAGRPAENAAGSEDDYMPPSSGKEEDMPF
jgi:single-strand DNA-binding protein